MSGLFKYLYALSAACFVGLGSGLLTITPYLIDRETEMMKLGSAYEQAAGVEYDDGFQCELGSTLYADCKVADYLASSNSILVSFFKLIGYSLFWFGTGAAALGLYFHLGESTNARAT